MERQYDYVLVDVFTETRLQGNPLAVFPHADEIAQDEMQRIAGELNLSETAFIVAPTEREAIARFRIFTPRRELNFAGHPTIGAAYVLARSSQNLNRIVIQENVGLIHVDVETVQQGAPVFWLTTPHLEFLENLDPAICARLLQLSTDDFAPNVTPQFVSAGSPLLFVCLKTPEAVDRAEVQPSHLREALGTAGSVGTFVFALKESHGTSSASVYARMFAPQTGISEDPATGGAIGPLAGYMLERALLPRSTMEFSVEQGVKMGRRSLLRARVSVHAGNVSTRVGGSVVQVAHGVFNLDC